MTIIIPKRERTLMVTSKYPAKINIPKKEIGNPKATQNARRVLRNKDKKINTKNTPMRAFSESNCVL